jgi:SAM-dependent methyltransferase
MNGTPDDQPPAHLAEAGGFRQREKMGRIWCRMIVGAARLPKDGAVLDVGCGLGRMAVPLVQHLGASGRYEGLDVDAEAIAWCQRHIGAAHANFRFTAVGVQSGRYNPAGGTPAASFVFPYPDASFDVVFLASVFTHLLPGAVERYLHELRRVLKPAGRCLASYFLLNARSEAAIAAGSVKPLHRFPHRLDGCSVLSRELPESAVAHDENRVRSLYVACGFRVIEPIRYGKWAGGAGPVGQDIVLASNSSAMG